MNFAIQTIVSIAAAVVLLHSIATINRMNAATNHTIRMSFVLLAAGSFGELLAILDGSHVPGIAEFLFVVGAGMLAFFCRRNQPRCDSADKCVNYERANDVA